MIKTKIAQIHGPTRFVLAAGKVHGVEEGMEFIIYELSDPIFDPETHEPLGQLELHKGRVKVIHVQEKLATATTVLKKKYQPSIGEIVGTSVLPIRAVSPYLNLSGEWVEEPEQLPIDQGAVTATKVDLTVKVGDLVRSVA